MEMRFLRRIHNKTKKNRIKNYIVRQNSKRKDQKEYKMAVLKKQLNKLVFYGQISNNKQRIETVEKKVIIKQNPIPSASTSNSRRR